MDIFSIITLFGGLAFFLYGMHLLSSSLEKMVGGKLERVLRSMTSSRFRSILLGMGITIAIQSSSAMTVMLVGLVNSGIMELGQTVGVIMGSNIGTTATAWILSLNGIRGDNFFLRMLRPESFSPVIAIVGIGLIMFAKRSKKRDIGSVMVGFAILMTGMTIMSDVMEPLAEMPEFREILTVLDHPVFGLLAGTLITAVIQSSAASLGILQSLSVTGRISFSMALPIILGLNIGTCITALLSSIGTKADARRVTAVHIYIKVIGSVIFMVAFYGLDMIFDFAFADQPVRPVMIAVVHSVFNILNTVILLPFCKQLEKLARFTVRDKKSDKEHEVFLDELLLRSPAFAIAECRDAAVRMAELAKRTILDAISLLSDFDEDVAERVEEDEQSIDDYEDKLGSYLVKISAKNLTHADSNDVAQLLHTIGDLERIGDHAVNLLRAAREIHDKELEFSKDAQSELAVCTEAVKEILTLTVDSFCTKNYEEAYRVEPLEQVIDALKVELKNRHIQRLQEGRCTIELGFVFSDIIHNYERISDHCSNVAVCMIQIRDSAMDTHGYLNAVKNGDPRFVDYYGEFSDKYVLPAASHAAAQA